MFTTNRIGWTVLGLVCLAIPSAWAAPADGREERNRPAAREQQGMEMQQRLQQMIDRRLDQRIRELAQKFRPEAQRRVAAFREQALPRMIETNRERSGEGFARRGLMRSWTDRGLAQPRRDGRGFGPPWLREGKAARERGRFGPEGRSWGFRGPGKDRAFPGMHEPMTMRERLHQRLGKGLSGQWECPMMRSPGRDHGGRSLGLGRAAGFGGGLGFGREAGSGPMRKRFGERMMANRGLGAVDQPARQAEGSPQADRPVAKERSAFRGGDDTDRPVEPSYRGRRGQGFGQGPGRGGPEAVKPEAGVRAKPVRPEAGAERGVGRGQANPEGRQGANTAPVRPNANPLFDVFDANHDGEIQPQELKHFGELLKKAVNENSDKPIKVDEWNRILRQIARESRSEGHQAPPRESKEESKR